MPISQGKILCSKAQIKFLFVRKYAHLGWHMAIKRTGFVKPGKKTFYPWGQQAIKFLHRGPYADPHPLKQLQNKHGMKLVIEKDGNVKGNIIDVKYDLL